MAHIKTYARLKPTKKPFSGFSMSKSRLTIPIPDNKDSLLYPNALPCHSNITYDIHFDNIFLPEANQEDVFENAAKDIIQNFLTGYNGTIFVYGQTGTGKTYTMEGNACRYQTRGLGTRALAMIYQELEKRKDEHITVYLSFLEIYQEVAYDLLNPASRTMSPVMPFSKVTVVEGPGGSCILRGLSLHLAANEDVAQMLLLQGQANRKIAETPVNMRSSRSHAVFSVYLQARKKVSEVVLSSKLHLIDLAGSERVSKTGVDGQQLVEAKSINLSLHHLETVIIVLQDEHQPKAPKRETSNHLRSPNSYMSRRHIPYRNSLLTMILKDSLGGNCLTAMIATLSLDPENLGETISTCRFAQRVACVSNFARRNEEIDDKMLIKKLKLRVAHLETQVSLLLSKSGGSVSDAERTEESELSSRQEESVNCQEIIEDFIHGIINDPVSAGICNQIQFRQCLQLMKCRMLEQGIVSTHSPNTLPSPGSKPQSNPKPLINNLFPSSNEDVVMESPPAKIISPEPSDNDVGVSLQESTKDRNESVRLSSPSTPIEVSKTLNNTPPKQYQDSSRTTRKESASAPVDKTTMDEIEMLLSRSGGSPSPHNSYKSPFERKREKEIKKLGKKLNSIEEEKAAQKGELELMKQDTVLNSLRMEEDSLRLKLQLADEQVADQHAYILHLKHLECDPDLMAQEVLVEKQLQKRQMKFRTKLDDTQERRTGVERELSKMAQDKGSNQGGEKKAEKSFEDRFGQYKQNKGSLNTRQVYEMLKNEEKKQMKEVGKVEREKTLIKTKQLELKEMATWEKLRELKQMLKMSQRQDEDEQQAEWMDAQGTGTELFSQNNNLAHLYSDSQASEQLRSPNDILDSINAQFVSTEHYKQNNNASPSYYDDKDISSPSKSISNKRNEEPRVDSLANPLDPRPSGKFVDFRNSKTNVSNGMDHDVDDHENKGNQNVKRDDNNNFKPGQENHTHNFKLNFTDLETNETEEGSKDVITQMSTSTSVCSTVMLNTTDVKSKEEGKSLTMEDIMGSLNPSTVQYSSNRSSDIDYSRNTLKNHKVLPPSEYINSMTEKERFDARRMGLSSRTFESALSHMLDETNNTVNTNVPDLPYSVDVYDKYARKSTTTSTRQHQPPKQHRSLQKKFSSPSSNNAAGTSSTVKSKVTNGMERKKKVMDDRSTWGPDVKNISVADRLSGLFDETPSGFLPSQNNTKKQQISNNSAMDRRDQGDSLSLDSMELMPKTSGVVVDESCSEDDSFFGHQTPRTTVTALKTDEGEKTFMSRVASERERIAKIRKARYAAEVIQKRWRKFKAKKE